MPRPPYTMIVEFEYLRNGEPWALEVPIRTLDPLPPESLRLVSVRWKGDDEDEWHEAPVGPDRKTEIKP